MAFKRPLRNPDVIPMTYRVLHLFFIFREDKYRKYPAFQYKTENIPEHMPSLPCPGTLMARPPRRGGLGGTFQGKLWGQTRNNGFNLQQERFWLGVRKAV